MPWDDLIEYVDEGEENKKTRPVNETEGEFEFVGQHCCINCVGRSQCPECLSREKREELNKTIETHLTKKYETIKDEVDHKEMDPDYRLHAHIGG